MAEPEEIKLQGTTEELIELIPQLMAFKQLLGSRNLGNLYTIPTTTFQDTFEFHPQVKLVFYKSEAEDESKQRTYGEISFRIMNETHETYNEIKAKALAEKIRVKFASPRSFEWHKGKLNSFYEDKKKGYRFRLLVNGEAEARRIIENTLDLQNHNPEWKRLRISQSLDEYPEIPEKEVIYGQPRRLPRRRPVEIVKFKYAELHIWGIPQAISLVDTTGYRATPLVT